MCSDHRITARRMQVLTFLLSVTVSFRLSNYRDLQLFQKSLKQILTTHETKNKCQETQAKTMQYIQTHLNETTPNTTKHVFGPGVQTPLQ
jgi:RNA processing factor Prp31